MSHDKSLWQPMPMCSRYLCWLADLDGQLLCLCFCDCQDPLHGTLWDYMGDVDCNMRQVLFCLQRQDELL